MLDHLTFKVNQSHPTAFVPVGLSFKNQEGSKIEILETQKSIGL